eukprot:gene1565-biopygen10790
MGQSNGPLRATSFYPQRPRKRPERSPRRASGTAQDLGMGRGEHSIMGLGEEDDDDENGLDRMMSTRAVYDIQQSHVNLRALRGPGGSVVGDPRCNELVELEDEMQREGTGDEKGPLSSPTLSSDIRPPLRLCPNLKYAERRRAVEVFDGDEHGELDGPGD